MIEIRISPKRRRWIPGRAQESFVFGVRHLSSGHEEGVDPDAMDGALAVLAGIGSQKEPGGRNLDQGGCDRGYRIGSGFGRKIYRHGGCHPRVPTLKFTSAHQETNDG